ncbi:MAG: hypothetical protein ACI4XP_04485 [Acutalibacteraceae bacterium]
MKEIEIYENNGIITLDEEIDVLYNAYQMNLSATSVRLFGYDLSNDDYDVIWNDVKDRHKDFAFENDLYNIVFDCYRKYIINAIMTKRLVITNSKSVLKYVSDYNSIKKVADENINYIMSLFYFLSDKQFHYFTDRYFFLKDDVEYNAKYEKKIAKIMELKGSLRRMKLYGVKPLKADPVYYPYYLLAISPLILRQTGGHLIFMEDKVEKRKSELRHCIYARANILAVLICFVVAVIILVLYFGGIF